MTGKTAILIVVLVFSLAGLEIEGVNGDLPGILGVWNNEDGRAKIKIFDCDDSFCGRIVWLKEPDYPPGDKSGLGGKPRLDLENPDPASRDRRLMGLKIMDGFVQVDKNAWGNGRIYDPVSGRTYRAKMTLESQHRLILRGYVGIPLFGKSTVWTR